MQAEDSALFLCPWCMEENEVTVDLTAGKEQTLVEDCAVCCHPMVLRLTADPVTGEILVDAQPES